MKDITEYTLEEILEEYHDIVEDIIESEDYIKEETIARLIVTAVLAGVNRNRQDKIKELIERTHALRYPEGIDGKINWKESNYDLMRKVIKDYPRLLEDPYYGDIEAPEEHYEEEDYYDINSAFDSELRRH